MTDSVELIVHVEKNKRAMQSHRFDIFLFDFISGILERYDFQSTSDIYRGVYERMYVLTALTPGVRFMRHAVSLRVNAVVYGGCYCPVSRSPL